MFMDIPTEVGVMTLPGVTLFPQMSLPLYIFEPRYRKMLAEALHSHRMFAIAMQRPGYTRECPSQVAGLGLIRVCVNNPDGTSHLVLQGLNRVELARTVHYKPFRICEIKALQAPAHESVAIDALMAKVRDLVTERIRHGLQIEPAVAKAIPVKQIINYLEKLNDPEEVADLVSGALLQGPEERQTILETIEIEPRLKHLIHFLMAEISDQKKKKKK